MDRQKSKPRERGQSRRPSLRPPPRPNDCTVTLPVEIDVQVKVRSLCKPWGSSRTRGGMSIEPPSEQQQIVITERLVGDNIKTENTNGPLPVLRQILRKQQKILKNLASSTPISISPQENLSLLSSNVSNDHTTEIIPQLNEINDGENEHTDDGKEEEEEIKQIDNDNDEEDLTEDEIDKQEFKKRNKSPNSRKIITRDEMDSFSNDIKVNSNISFDDIDKKDEKQYNKKLNKKVKKIKTGKTNFPPGSAFEGEENLYQFDIQGSQMVELFNRRKLKVTKINQTNHAGGKNKIEMDKDGKTVQKDKNYGH